MDIPLFKDFDSKTGIEIKTPEGWITLFPNHGERGLGHGKWKLKIIGSVKGDVEPMKQCYVLFRGAELGGQFTKIDKREHISIVTFETIIPNPEFWGEV